LDELSYLLGLGSLPPLRAAVACDVDGDGQEDLILAGEDGSLHLMADGGSAGSFARLQLTAETGTAYGAVVEITTKDRVQARLNHGLIGPSSYQASDLHVGLGAEEALESVIVRWPSGHVDEWSDLPVRQTLHLREQQSTVEWSPLIAWDSGATFGRPVPRIGGYARLLDGRNHPLGNPEIANLMHLVAHADAETRFPWDLDKLPPASELEISLLVMDSDGWAPASDARFQGYTLSNHILSEFLGTDFEPDLPATFLFAPGGSLVRQYTTPPDYESLLAA